MHPFGYRPVVRRTKIVATIGPASASPDVLGALIGAGMDVARLGLAHGRVEDHLERVGQVRDVAQRNGKHVGVLGDLPGPKVRTTTIAEPVVLREGSNVELYVGEEASGPGRLVVDYDNLLQDLRPGDVVGLGDGSVTLRVDDVGDHVSCVVLHGGSLLGRPGVKVPTDRLSEQVPTQDDRELIERCAEASLDFLAVSFVRAAADIERVRALIGTGGPMIVAKIETKTAVQNLEEILQASDAVMVARGDLGADCAIEEVPHLQKRIIRRSIALARPVITATQMLESMIQSPVPTRAEVSDVANAVLDGTDAVMLSGETAVGHDPELVVRTMARIVERAEAAADLGQWEALTVARERANPVTTAMTHAAWRAAIDADVAAILCCTRSGTTARAMAALRPAADLIGLSPHPETLRQQTLTWGVQPLALPESNTAEEVVDHAIRAARAAGAIADGEMVAVLAGAPEGGPGKTDLLRIAQVR